MIPVQIETITPEHIRSLLMNSKREGRTIEYKQKLPGGLDAEKKEFLADISSFANASGGDLIYGIAAKDGVPTEIMGLDDFDPDKDCLRLDNIIRDNIQPRILGYQIHPLDYPKKGSILIIRIPRSWSGPHIVAYKGSSRFFTRCSAGKYQMDVGELRDAFALSGNLPMRIRQWRDDRIGKIIAGETPILLANAPNMIMHLVPLDSFDNAYRIAVSEFTAPGVNDGFSPIGVSNYNRGPNLDGYMKFDVQSRQSSEKASHSYCQIFRSGRVESVRNINTHGQDSPSNIPSVWFERVIIEATADYLKSLVALDVHPPLVLMLTFTGVKGMCMSERDDSIFDPRPIDRNVLLLPDVMIEETPTNIPCLLQPTFDAVWNACGFVRSFNYNNTGKWIGPTLSSDIPQED